MTEPRRPSVRDVEYKGEPLDGERGPGLGCFWIQVALLAILVVLTPLSAAWDWPAPLSLGLLVALLILLLFAGQTVIFLLRLVAADRRADARRRPLRSATKTVGELEDETAGETQTGPAPDGDDPGGPAPGGVRE